LEKILIFGNSGSGKSTLAKKLCAGSGQAHLDLDTLAWRPSSPPQRRPVIESQIEIEKFIWLNDGWVIEGCYADLLEIAVSGTDVMIFLNLPVEACLKNARNRPWEPHKYESKQAQDANLEMLLSWISKYPERTDAFSESAHQDLFSRFPGRKMMLTSNESQLSI
jgi:adenylate kinase family enzyme